MNDEDATKFDRVYRWGKFIPALKGKRCRVLARGAMNTALVEFADGTKHVVSRNALAKLPEAAK